MEKFKKNTVMDKSKKNAADLHTKPGNFKKKDKIDANKKEDKKQTLNFNKSKSKTKTKTETKTKITKQPEITEWYYMSPNKISAKMIADFLKERKLAEVELWEEMNILQIVLKENKCVDFEPLNQPFKDETDVLFLKENNITTVFAVTIDEGTFSQLQPLMSAVIQEWEGFLCADSYNFKPKLALKELNGNNL